MARKVSFQQQPPEQSAVRTRETRPPTRRGTEHSFSPPESGAPRQHTQGGLQHLLRVPQPVCSAMPEGWNIATLTIQKDERSQLGVDVGNVRGDQCGPIILGLGSSGVIPEWNRQNAANPLRPGHIILETDGAFDYWGVVQKLSETGKHTLRVLQVPRSHSWHDQISVLVRELGEYSGSFGFVRSLRPGSPTPARSTSMADTTEPILKVLVQLPYVWGNDVDTERCCICLEALRSTDKLAQLPCSHCLHSICAARLMSQNQRHTCPVCIQPVTGRLTLLMHPS